ncbi:hypothetical protein ANN_03556 [Periplaneta americana]|uniref:MADF domain-containing protein n=1 Tax=Periplaneta americana TaxID=6978 RepID=A0ABQ8U2A7_PERAM|nr:hypothetical protein ANN_03556 [Periplaneta americana]
MTGLCEGGNEPSLKAICKCVVLEMSSSESEYPDDCGSDSRARLVTILSKHPMIFNKSQIRMIKGKKEKAWGEIVNEYQQELGKSTSEKQLKKKVQNMKAEFNKERGGEKEWVYNRPTQGWRSPSRLTAHERNADISCALYKGGLEEGIPLRTASELPIQPVESLLPFHVDINAVSEPQFLSNHESLGIVCAQYRHITAEYVKICYNGWGAHRANHTIPPFWLNDRPPLLRHVDVRPAAGWSVLALRGL